MKKIADISELKSIQLDILSRLDDYCSSNSITYSIIDGTLLGAVRHKGYIPWDDDIDVAMDRENYTRFIKSYPINDTSHYQLYSLERNEKWDRAYACMFDDRTILNSSEDSEIGVLIDIFPMDAVPENHIQWKILVVKMKILYMLRSLKNIKSNRVSNSLVKNIIAFVVKIIISPFSRRYIAERLDKLARSYENSSCTKGYEVAFAGGTYRYCDLILFKSVIQYQFEDRTFYGLKDADSFLKSAYGDYMQLPPKEERVSHHDINAYWK